MATTTLGGPAAFGAAEVLRCLARGILILIAAFWLWFCIADGLGDAKELGAIGFVMMLPAAIIVLAALYIAWRWEYAGAWVLLGVALLGGFIALKNTLQSTLPQEQLGGQFVLNFAMLSLPFVIASVLLFVKYGIDQAAAR